LEDGLLVGLKTEFVVVVVVRPGLKALSFLTLWTPHHPLPENPVMVKRVGRLVVTWREKPLPKSLKPVVCYR
jgi:hypothetical protein